MSYHVLFQGFLPGIFGVSHGALQFMAYEELKKLHNKYHNNALNKKLVSSFAALHTSWHFSFFIIHMFILFCQVSELMKGLNHYQSESSQKSYPIESN